MFYLSEIGPFVGPFVVLVLVCCLFISPCFIALFSCTVIQIVKECF